MCETCKRRLAFIREISAEVEDLRMLTRGVVGIERQQTINSELAELRNDIENWLNSERIQEGPE